jgi:phage shock protein PspC (stress-responsive transcriptional regulator)
MKKAIKVNISGSVFTIDEDAYQKLNVYLDEINSRFSNDEEGNEIIADVEARISELFLSKITETKQVINVDDVDDVIKIMGTPDDFTTGDPDYEETEEKGERRRNRRMYRDPDNTVIAGVCSGMAAYFDADILLIRIIFVVLLLLGAGVMAIVYIILWIVVPTAQTTAQKLEMRGEKVNISTIEKSIREELTSVNKNFQELRKTPNYRKTTDIANRSVSVFANIIAFILKFFVKIVFFVIIIGAFIGLISLAIGLFFGHSFLNGDIMFSEMPPIRYFTQFLTSPLTITLGIISLFLLVGIPLLMLIYIGVKVIFRFKSNNLIVGMGALGLWLISLGVFAVIGIQIAADFSARSKVVENYPITTKSTKIYLKLSDKFKDIDLDINEFDINEHNFRITSDNDSFHLYGKPKLDIEKSENNQIQMSVIKTSRGRTRKNAEEKARLINFTWQQLDSVITFDRYFTIEQNGAWKNQEMRIIMKIPIGTSVFLDPSVDEIIYDIENIENLWDHDMTGKTWIMKPEGLGLSPKDSLNIKKSDNNDEESIEEMKKEMEDAKKELKETKQTDEND